MSKRLEAAMNQDGKGAMPRAVHIQFRPDPLAD